MRASLKGRVALIVLGLSVPAAAGANAQQFDRPAVWSGAYAGINAGYGWSRFGSPAGTDSYTASGGLAGVHAGYNWQARYFVAGIEADYDFSGIGRSATDTAGDKVRFTNGGLGSIRARAGIVADRALIFATLGYAIEPSAIRLTDPTGANFKFSNINAGLVYGGGVEFKFSSQMSLRGEVLRYDTTGTWTDTTGAKVKIDTPTTTVRAGVSYHF